MSEFEPRSSGFRTPAFNHHCLSIWETAPLKPRYNRPASHLPSFQPFPVPVENPCIIADVLWKNPIHQDGTHLNKAYKRGLGNIQIWVYDWDQGMKCEKGKLGTQEGICCHSDWCDAGTQWAEPGTQTPCGTVSRTKNCAAPMPTAPRSKTVSTIWTEEWSREGTKETSPHRLEVKLSCLQLGVWAEIISGVWVRWEGGSPQVPCSPRRRACCRIHKLPRGLLRGPLMRCGQVRRSFQKNDVCKVMLKTMLSSARGMGLFRGLTLWFVKCCLWMKRVAKTYKGTAATCNLKALSLRHDLRPSDPASRTPRKSRRGPRPMQKDDHHSIIYKSKAGCHSKVRW